MALAQSVRPFDLFMVPTSSQGSLIFSSKESAFSVMLSKFHVILRHTFRKPALDKTLKHQPVVLFAFDLILCAVGQEDIPPCSVNKLSLAWPGMLILTVILTGLEGPREINKAHFWCVCVRASRDD